MASSEIYSLKKSNLRIYQGKDRIYPPVAGAPNVRKILVWDDEKKEYRPPIRGKMYYARRYEVDAFGKKKRKLEYFETLESARTWQAFGTEKAQDIQPASYSNSAIYEGPFFRDIIAEWKERKYPSLRVGTKVQYNQVIDHHFQMLMNYRINAITPKIIDAWLAERKCNLDLFPQSKKRTSFSGELGVLKIIFRYYAEYHDEDPVFRVPIKRRHLQDAKLSVYRPAKKKDLTEEEFYRFRSELEKLKHGPMLSSLSTVQYFEALRISEAAGLFWEDIRFNWSDPVESRIQVVRYVAYSQEKGVRPTISAGFKNSKSVGGVKELPMFYQTFQALKNLHFIGAKGPIFRTKDGGVFEYHVIRDAYNTAFRKAGLPYSATHVMRHGWTREILDDTNGDFAVAGQLLGNTDRESINTYAKRNKSALTVVARRKWLESDNQREAGRNWPQTAVTEN
jgi:integrase